jgi:hypothetical protein
LPLARDLICLTRNFDIIDIILSDYEWWQANIGPLLMLALWKWNMSKIIADGYTCDSVKVDEMKVKSRYDSESMATIIVPNVLEFLCIQEKQLGIHSTHGNNGGSILDDTNAGIFVL